MATGGQKFKSSIDYAALGNRLRAYRVGAALQAEEIAAELGVSRAVVYRMEKGEIVKIETLERLAKLLGTSLASILGVEVEYYPNVLGLFERMRQLEQTSERIFAHFEPISQLLTSDAYLQSLHTMLLEAVPRQTGGVFKQKEVDELMRIIVERRAWFESKRPHLVALIGLQELQRFVQLGVVGRLELPDEIRRERQQLAVLEVERMADLMENEPLNVQIGLIDDVMPSSTFQLFTSGRRKFVAVSPFRLGEIPNVRTGIATVTAAPEALKMYENMIARLWRHAHKGKAGAQLLREMLKRHAAP
ncbi:helix-turn-helix transcriptional regulator [Pusillimonas sp. CC-YST705]|uniref:Helix-turn-helix transcriptional regulator n=1 Tax=Mesopusillimonas faecipullorum TaxID=2755040 RepID=A0ABS8C9Z5_9BURK|nr:helix-turn-helix transcriptional regulator [Mesopusillimonas faecipullorum]MCB5362659.1 helix-turn-helix transcriptional regulator [Mesopusillimonas faecipullorum]